MYGLTETYGPATVAAWPPEWDVLPAEERALRRARQGVPTVLGGAVDVWDAEGAPVPRDGSTMGEVVLRGNTVMAGYLDDAAATAEAFRGGWFHSGDAAVVHPDGRIELRDRFKDVIVSGGENISTIEVEQALARHPAVLDCAVVGVPDDHWGERPKAFVELRPGARGAGRGADGVLPRAARGLQVPRQRRVRQPAAHGDGQGAEVRAARARMGGPRAPRQLTQDEGDGTDSRRRVAPRWTAARRARERRHRLRAARSDPAHRAAARSRDDASARRLDAGRRRHAPRRRCASWHASGSRAIDAAWDDALHLLGVLKPRQSLEAIRSAAS